MVDVTKYSFMAFCGSNYYPQGGMLDSLKDDFGVAMAYETKEEALKEILQYAIDNDIDWWHIFDLSTGSIVDRSK